MKKDGRGHPFSYCLPDSILEKLPAIDSLARGVIGVSEQVINTGERDRYIVSSLIEEAITSSQLEGAATTRKDAADMLRSGRPAHRQRKNYPRECGPCANSPTVQRMKDNIYTR